MIPSFESFTETVTLRTATGNTVVPMTKSWQKNLGKKGPDE